MLRLSWAVTIERVQRCALYIVLGEDYLTYESAWATLNEPTLTKEESNCVNILLRKSSSILNIHIDIGSVIMTNCLLESRMKTRSDPTKNLNKLKPVQNIPIWKISFTILDLIIEPNYDLITTVMLTIHEMMWTVDYCHWCCLLNHLSCKILLTIM